MYNILQVLWSSKVKSVSLSQLLGCPKLWSFQNSRFYCLTCEDLKKNPKTQKPKKTSLLAKPVLLVFFGCSQLRQPSPALLRPD